MAIHNISVDANSLRTSLKKVKQSFVARCAALATLLVLSSACCAHDAGSELEVRESLRVGVKILWDAQNYKALDAMAADYMSKRARTPSGLWKYGLIGANLKTQLNPNVDDAAWEVFMDKRVRFWPRMAPQSPFAHMLVAEALASRAWRKRGGGYAHQVSPENWAVFHQYIEEARLYLESTKKVSSRDMSWYTLMTQISVWQSWPEHRLEALVKESMDRDRDFFPVYFAALDYYSPNWGGDAKKIEAFAARLATQLQEPRGDAYYARVYWWAVDNHFKGRLGDSKVNCARLQHGMQTVAAEFPDPWNINKFARFAVECGDKAAAIHYFDQIGDAPLLEVWGGSMKTFLQFRALTRLDTWPGPKDESQSQPGPVGRGGSGA